MIAAERATAPRPRPREALRVLLQCAHYGPPWNEGVKNTVAQLASDLRRRGHTVLVAARVLSRDADGRAPAGAMEVGVSPIGGFIQSGVLAAAHEVDVVHTIQSANALTAARTAALARLAGCPVLLHVTGLGRLPLPLLRSRGLGRRAGASAVVVGSPYLTRLYPGAEVLPPLPALDDTSPLEPASTDGPPVIAFLGSFEPGRGVEDLIRACQRLRAGGHAFELRLAWNGFGGPEGRARVTALARAQGVPLSLAGTVDRRAFYGAARVVVVPRVMRRRMTLPVRLVECALLERPVVVPRLLDMDRFVDGMGAAFTPGDPDDLARALASLLTDDARYRRCIQEARRRRGEFSPEATFARFDEIYRGLCSGVLRRVRA